MLDTNDKNLLLFLQGLFLGMILYGFLSVIGLTKTPLAGIHLTVESFILLGCLK
jgi:hypothetical protein